MLHPKQQFIVDAYGKEPETLDEIAEAAIAAINAKSGVPLVGFAWDIAYKERIRNSHSCPVNGEKNWGHKPGLPKGYPGFYGRIWTRYADKRAGFGSEHIDASLTHSGTGGIGSYDGLWQQIASAAYRSRNEENGFEEQYKVYCFSYDYRFFLEDFPAFVGSQFEEVQRLHQKDKDDYNIAVDARNQETEWNLLQGKRPYRTPLVAPKIVLSHKFKWQDPAIEVADAEFLLS